MFVSPLWAKILEKMFEGWDATDSANHVRRGMCKKQTRIKTKRIFHQTRSLYHGATESDKSTIKQHT